MMPEAKIVCNLLHRNFVSLDPDPEFKPAAENPKVGILRIFSCGHF